MKEEGSVEMGQSGVDELRVVERRVRIGGPDDSANEVDALLDRGQIGDCVGANDRPR